MEKNDELFLQNTFTEHISAEKYVVYIIVRQFKN